METSEKKQPLSEELYIPDADFRGIWDQRIRPFRIEFEEYNYIVQEVVDSAKNPGKIRIVNKSYHRRLDYAFISLAREMSKKETFSELEQLIPYFEKLETNIQSIVNESKINSAV